MSIGASVPWDPVKCANCGQWLSPGWRDKCLHCGAPMAIAKPAPPPPPPPAPFTKSIFRGVSVDDATRQAEADALKARANGYEPESQSWTDDKGVHVLTVVYRYAGRASIPPPALGSSSTGPTNQISETTVAGVALIIAAALTGLLALQQYNTAQTLKAIIDTSTLSTDAIVNAGTAVVAVIVGAKLLRDPTPGALVVAIVFAILSVAGGVIQPASLANPSFVGGIIAAGVAGVASFMARQRQNA